MPVVWFSDPVQVVNEQIKNGLHNAGEYIKRRLKEKVSRGYSPPPSRPGQPPHIDTAELWGSIKYEIRNGVIKVSAAQHGVYLEYGVTGRMAARPWLRNTVKLEEWRMQHLIAKG